MVSDYNLIGEHYVAQQKLHVDWSTDGPTQFIEKSLQGVNGYILDVGCGTGDLIKYFSDKGYLIRGIDKSREMALRYVNPEVSSLIRIVSMEYTGFVKESFDAIISRYALHYLEDFSKTYEEFNRLLKPDGVLAIVAEHPICDLELNKKYQSGIDTSLNLFGVKLDFPSHTIKDYFSKDFFKYFTIENYDEGDERNFSSKVPAYIAFKARKNSA